MATRTGPDQAPHMQMTIRWARSRVLFRKGQVIAMKVFWAVVFAFIAMVLTQKAWHDRPGMLLLVLGCGLTVGLWVGSGGDKARD